MFSAALKSGAVSTTTDAQFNYVTMLLHGDGTNGAQNNTFLDSSTNNYTITRHGNTTQGSFSPYGSNWSNYFDGTTDYLTIAGTSTACALPSDFTIECFYYQLATTNYGNLFSTTTTYTTANSLRVSTGNTTNTFQVASAGAGILNASTTFTPNSWVHVALVRSGTTITLYQNGVSVGSATNSQSFVSDAFIIGDVQGAGAPYCINGYMSNFRVVKGTAVYTTTFTPPTAPLTAITNTQLLTCQSNRFIDNSTNNFTITKNGDTSVQRFNPFGTSTAYSTSVIGGSGYFDGTVDYIDSSFSAISVGTGDFTYEVWIYRTGSAGGIFQGIICANDYSNGILLQWIDATNCDIYINGNNSLGGTCAITLNAWTHIAILRASGVSKLYRNGTLVRSYSDSSSLSITSFTVGGSSHDPSEAFFGYTSGVRFTTSAVYSGSSFTLPTAPPTAIANTKWLVNFVNGAIYDNAMMNNLETVGNAQISTSVKKYGTGSMYFDGTGDWLTSLDNPSHEFGSGNFTLECWINTTVSNSGYVSAVAKWSSSNQSWMIRAASTDIGSGWSFFYSTNGSNYYTVFGSSINDGNWHHLAVTRSGNVFRTFTDGTLNNSTTDAVTLFNGTASLFVGAQGGGSNPFTGYIDDLRITKGYARYTASFTAPTAAFPNTGPY